MVSTRHHPREFPPPEEAMSPPPTISRRVPRTPVSTTSSSTRPTADSPPPPSTRRAASRKRKSIIPKTEEDEIKQITEEAAKHADDVAVALTTRSHTRSPRPTSSKTKPRKSTTTATGSYEHTPSPFLILWLLISVPLVIWDTGYVLGRPHTMPGGWLHRPIFSPYELYGRMDHTYGKVAYEAKSGFPSAQGMMNLIETVSYIAYLYIIGKRTVEGDGFVRGIALKSFNVFSRRDDRDRAKIIIRGDTDVASAVVLLFGTAVMTWSKTVLYGLREYYAGFAGIRQNPIELLLLWIFMTCAWIIGPIYMCWVLGVEIVEAITSDKGGRRPRKRVDED